MATRRRRLTYQSGLLEFRITLHGPTERRAKFCGLPKDWIGTLFSECQRRFQSELVPIAGAVNTVKAIAERVDHVCVTSSTEFARLCNNLEWTGLLTCLEFAQPGEARPKPAPDVFLFAASQMGFDPAETIVIEDSEKFVG